MLRESTNCARGSSRRHERWGSRDEAPQVALCYIDIGSCVRDPGPKLRPGGYGRAAGGDRTARPTYATWRRAPGGDHLAVSRLHTADRPWLLKAEPGGYRPYLYALAIRAERAQLVEPATGHSTARYKGWPIAAGPSSNTAMAPYCTFGSVTSHPPATGRSGSELSSAAR